MSLRLMLGWAVNSNVSSVLMMGNFAALSRRWAALGLTVCYECDLDRDTSVNAIDVQLVINAALGIGL